jgi:hypothetical protein
MIKTPPYILKQDKLKFFRTLNSVNNYFKEKIYQKTETGNSI